MSTQLLCSKPVTNTLGVADFTRCTSFDSRRTADAHARISLKSSVKTRAESLIAESHDIDAGVVEAASPTALASTTH
jgi:hypothetical protein